MKTKTQTLTTAKRIVRALSLKLARNEYDEYVVTGMGANGQLVEYFASDIDDAVQTAQRIAEARDGDFITKERARLAKLEGRA